LESEESLESEDSGEEEDDDGEDEFEESEKRIELLYQFIDLALQKCSISSSCLSLVQILESFTHPKTDANVQQAGRQQAGNGILGCLSGCVRLVEEAKLEEKVMAENEPLNTIKKETTNAPPDSTCKKNYLPGGALHGGGVVVSSRGVQELENEVQAEHRQSKLEKMREASRVASRVISNIKSRWHCDIASETLSVS